MPLDRSDVAQRPNVLFITADQWRGDTLGCLGHPCIKTPALDSLASEGTLFRSHFVQASPCGPGRASLYTGLYMFSHRAVDNGTPLDARFTNVALEVRRAGYDPTLFGYTSTSVDPRTVEPGDPRLSDYEGVLPGLTAGDAAGKWTPWLSWLEARGFKGPLNEETPAIGAGRHGSAQGPERFTAPTLYSSEESETAFLCDALLRWLRLRKDRAWFAHLSIKKPHPPWLAPAPYNTMYASEDVPPTRRASTAADDARQHPFLAWMIEHQKRAHYTLAKGRLESDLDEKEIRSARAAYYGLISEVDHHVGRIVDYLRETGEYDRTLIVFTSDHGEHLGDHYLLGKSGYFDAGFHVPLVVRDPSPGARAGRAVDEFTEAVDVMPTILDILGIKIPAQCDGESLRPFLRGESPAGWRTEAHWEFDFRDVRSRHAGKVLGLAPDQCNLAVVRGRRFKYVHFAGLPPLFFDLADDPFEFKNRAGDPALAAEQLASVSRMLSWRMTHADRVLANMHVGEGGLFEWQGPRRAECLPA